MTPRPPVLKTIEVVDLSDSGSANAFTLSAQDVLDITSGDDLLSVFGDANDSIDAGSGWADGGFDSDGNHIFTQSVNGDLATLLLAPEISFNGDILA